MAGQAREVLPGEIQGVWQRVDLAASQVLQALWMKTLNAFLVNIKLLETVLRWKYKEQDRPFNYLIDLYTGTQDILFLEPSEEYTGVVFWV